jgi:hypothetical protein
MPQTFNVRLQLRAASISALPRPISALAALQKAHIALCCTATSLLPVLSSLSAG